MSTILIEEGLSLIQNRGIAQYTLGIFKLLNDAGYKVKMPRKVFLENIKNNTLRRILYIIWLNTFFIIKLILSKNISKVIFTSTTVPFLKVKNIEYISVLHDVLSKVHPECRTKIQNIHAEFATQTAIRYADKIITVSNFSKSEILKYYNIDSNKIFIVNSSCSTNLNFEPKPNESLLQELGIQSKKYILSVATAYKHKNTQMIINAFDEISAKYFDIKLVLVGQPGNCKLESQNLNVIFAGFVSNENLSYLYQQALLYVFPSIYEGFGAPCLDAQKFGIPLVCSDIPVFREVAGDGAEFCKPTIRGFVDAIGKIMNVENYKHLLIENGKINEKKYSLINLQKQLIEVVK